MSGKKPELGRYLKETGYALGAKPPRLDQPTPGVTFFALPSDWSPTETFMAKFRRGEVSADQITDYIDAWHGDVSEMTLPMYLGMTVQEYGAWVEDPTILERLR
jgi:hypothetical protein